MALANARKSRSAPPIWGALDSILDAYSVALKEDQHLVAYLAMATALALGPHLGLPDKVIQMMGASAAAAARRKPVQGRVRVRERPPVQDHGNVSR